MTTATAIANPNLAFIKYWGNRANVFCLLLNGFLTPPRHNYGLPLILLSCWMDKYLAQYQLRPVLQSFRQVRRLDLLAPRQIRNRTRQLQDAVIPPRR